MKGTLILPYTFFQHILPMIEQKLIFCVQRRSIVTDQIQQVIDLAPAFCPGKNKCVCLSVKYARARTRYHQTEWFTAFLLLIRREFPYACRSRYRSKCRIWWFQVSGMDFFQKRITRHFRPHRTYAQDAWNTGIDNAHPFSSTTLWADLWKRSSSSSSSSKKMPQPTPPPPSGPLNTNKTLRYPRLINTKPPDFPLKTWRAPRSPTAEARASASVGFRKTNDLC